MGSIGLQGRAIGQSTLIPQHFNAAKLGNYTYTTFLAQGTYLASTGYGPPTAPTDAVNPPRSRPGTFTLRREPLAFDEGPSAPCRRIRQSARCCRRNG